MWPDYLSDAQPSMSKPQQPQTLAKRYLPVAGAGSGGNEASSISPPSVRDSMLLGILVHGMYVTPLSSSNSFLKGDFLIPIPGAHETCLIHHIKHTMSRYSIHDTEQRF